MNDLARVETERAGTVAVVRIAGEVDMSNASDILSTIEASASSDVSTLVLDLADVGYLDSAGVRILFALAERLRSTRRGLRLVVPEGSLIRPVLELMDVARAVPVRADIESALSDVE